MSGSTYAPCAEHAEALATFQCDGCGRRLCYDCVDEDHRLNLCRLCGERVHHLEDSFEPTPEEPPASGLPPMDILYQERRAAPPPVTMADDPSTLLFNHVIVPGATIVMVSSLLFFLLDVRSVFLSGSANLKWLGFWFVLATVLIARYGKTAGQADRVGCYSLGLAVATLLAITFGPWQRQDSGWVNPLFNGLILLAVWRFATAVTSGLALEGEEKKRQGQRLYGLERITMEVFQRHRRGRPPKPASDPPPLLPTARSPNVAVARLAAVVMVVFALGEPVLLRGGPTVAARGFAAMVAFLLAAGIVLGAGAALDVFRRVRQAGGRISSTLVPRRTGAAAVAIVVLLSIALAMPGVESTTPSDDGDSQTDSSSEGNGDGDGDGGPTATEGSQQTFETQAGDPQRAAPPPPKTAGESHPDPLRISGSMVSALATLGRWLSYPALLVALIVAVLAMGRLLPLLGGWRGLGQRLAELLRRFGSFFRLSRGTTARRPAIDPWGGIERLPTLPPEEAVRRAYGHVLLQLDHLGYARLRDRTPHEVLAGLPRRFHKLRPSLARLTELYVAGAYGPDGVTVDDRQTAVQELDRLRRASEALVRPT